MTVGICRRPGNHPPKPVWTQKATLKRATNSTTDRIRHKRKNQQQTNRISLTGRIQTLRKTMTRSTGGQNGLNVVLEQPYLSN